MMRRRFLAGLFMAGATELHRVSARAAATSRVKPGLAGWPSDAEWANLKQAVGGRLLPVALPDLADPAVQKLLGNPFYVRE